MHDATTPQAGETLANYESAIHALLIADESQRPWSIHEVTLEMDDAGATTDALRSLQGFGLIHRCGDFVWPTRAAVAADQIAM
jgi:hypothetical protein